MTEKKELLTSIGILPNFRLCAAGFVAEDKKFFMDIASRLNAEHHSSNIRGYFDDPEVRIQDKPVILVLNASHVDFNSTEILRLRQEGYGGGILVVFGRNGSYESDIAQAYEDGADEFVRLPLAEYIVTIRIMALLSRITALSDLKSAKDRLTELLHFIHHDLATPVSTLQLSLTSLNNLNGQSDKARLLIARAIRAISRISETLNIIAPEEPTRAD